MKTAEERFKTYGEAHKYCADNGLIIGGADNPWEMANLIMKIRADQDKITRHDCAEIVLEKSAAEPLELSHAIMNTKAV